MRAEITLILVGFSTALTTAGCARGTPRVLESISVAPKTVTAQNAQATFTATGHYNTDPTTVPSLPVSWVVMGPAGDPPGPGYALSATPLTAQCRARATYTVVAYAPTNPDAPSSGSMPSSVFSALVLEQSTTSDDGFVAGTATMNCP